MNTPNFLGREPILFLGMVHAVIALAIGFGLAITVQQFALIEIAVVAVVSFIVRSNVTPLAAPVLATGTQVTTPDGNNAIVTKASPNQ